MRDVTYEIMKKEYTNLVFLKTKRPATTKEDLEDENLILEADTPELVHGKTKVISFTENDYPLIFAQSTAMQAGMQMIAMCEELECDVTPESVKFLMQEVEKNMEERV